MNELGPTPPPGPALHWALWPCTYPHEAKIGVDAGPFKYVRGLEAPLEDRRRDGSPRRPVTRLNDPLVRVGDVVHEEDGPGVRSLVVRMGALRDHELACHVVDRQTGPRGGTGGEEGRV